jgi:transcriptional regulator with XRE-family HTH domain
MRGEFLAPTADPAERAVSRRLRELRQAAGWSQSDVASRMTARGWSWHQTTVYKTEQGIRSLRVGELTAAAAVFGISPGTLLSGDGFEIAVNELKALDRRLREHIAAEILAGAQEVTP